MQTAKIVIEHYFLFWLLDISIFVLHRTRNKNSPYFFLSPSLIEWVWILPLWYSAVDWEMPMKSGALIDHGFFTNIVKIPTDCECSNIA